MSPRGLSCLAAVVIASLATPAAAIERQHHLGVGGGLSMLKIDDKSTLSVGAGLSLHYAYGLSDAFNFMAEGSSSIVALDEKAGPNVPATRPSGVDTLGVGAGYVFDVLRWVPYAGILGTGYALGGGSTERSVLVAGAQLAVGLDYQVSRNFGLGFAYRQHFLLSQLSTYPTYTQFFLRAEYSWGF